MNSLTRRAALRLGSVTLASGVAGCLGFGQQSPTTTELAELGVTNRTPNPQTANIVILDGDEPVYWQTKQVPAAEGDEGGAVSFEGLPTDPADYVVHVRINSQPESEWERFDSAAYDASCLSLRVTIGLVDSADSTDVGIFYTADESAC
jgi:hypothetical protein